MNRQALGKRGETNRLYTRIARKSAHLSISAVSHQLSPAQQPTEYTMHFVKWLPRKRRTRHNNDIKSLTQSVIETRKNRPQAPSAFIANYGFPESPGCHNSIPVMG